MRNIKSMTSRFRFMMAGLLLVACAASTAHAWWDNAWTTRHSLKIDPSAAGVPLTAPVYPGAVLLRLHSGNFDFASANADGSDIRIVVAADDQTVIPHHIERYSSDSGEAFLWVEIPEIKPANTPLNLWLYSGNSDPKIPAAQASATPVGSDALVVYHFSEEGKAPQDISGQGNNARNAGAATVGSFIGGGLRLDGKNTVSIPGRPSLAWTESGSFTLSAWVKFGEQQFGAVFFSRREGNNYLLLGADRGVPFIEVSRQGSVERSTATGTAVVTESWHHVALVSAAGSLSLFIDGQAFTKPMSTRLPAMAGDLVLGGNGEGGQATTDGFFAGEMDQFEMMRSVRTPEELKFAAVLQVADQAEKGLPIGPAERKTGPLDFLKEGYIGVIIDSLTVDGWVVIGILAIMSAVSCWVMFSKLSYLNNAIKANQVFLRAWSHLSRDLTGLEDENGGLNAKLDPRGKKLMRNSPLYHVYHTGVEEIRHRLKDESGKEGGDAMDKDGGLSGRSIEAIRASMDGTLIRENEKLTSNMVLLTIAISGGPFLGLLGTVVGVMITFAAVAQAGDVNVNAIAPGIAAALAATVAGLAVAIPALFGYNYLLTRIKATTNDLHVFIDEFVTKLAEFHAEETEEVE